MILNKYLNIINKNKTPIYIIFFIIYFLLYYTITVPELVKENTFINKLHEKKWVIGLLIAINIIITISLISSLIYYFKHILQITELKNLLFIITYILIFAILIFFNILIFSKELFFISKSVIIKYIFTILSSIFYVIFVLLFFYNINVELNIEFFISLEILLLFLLEYIFISINGINNINYKLKHDDFSILTINCFDKKNINERYQNENNQTDIDFKTIENIPISFYNKNIDDYQDLILADFYYPGSYYSYLADSPLNGTPNLEALKIVLTDFKARIIHLDVYSDKKDPYDPNALPIIRCENMKEGASPLNFDDTMNLINKLAWNTDKLSYPLFLYLNFNFNEDNENIYVRIYESLIKIFSKYFIDKKYSFSGRNSTFPISKAKIKDCLGKIIIITNRYPTKTVLDELINGTINGTFNLNIYKESYITYDKQGLSQDNDKNVVLNNAKSTLNFYYTIPNSAYKNNNQNKAGLYNPSFQDCAQYGIQGTLMYVFLPDDNLNKWNAFFKNKNNLNPVLKDESLRLINNAKVEIQKQNPVIGLQKPQKYCVVPGLISTEKSNLSGDTANSTC